jgi:hypothetical protein
MVTEETITDVQEAFDEALNSITEETSQLLPKNSESSYIEENTNRFSGAIWFNKIKEQKITTAGLGGIGSYVTFLLSRLQPNIIFAYDDDIVDVSNMSGQLYGLQDLGYKKVTALAGLVTKYSDYNRLFTFPEKYTEKSGATDIMICGFDNMVARQTFYDNWVNHINNKSLEDKKKCLFIDGRLAAESIQILCMTGDDYYNRSNYTTKWLFSDYEADTTICSYKQTTFCANMIGSLIVNLFVNFCANLCNPIIPRDLPFLTTYEAETMYFKTIN